MKKVIRNIALAIMLTGLSYGFTYAQITFKKTYENINSQQSIVRPTADGGYILLTRVINNPTYGNDLLLIKLSANGDTLWAKIMGELINDNVSDIHQSDDGGFIISARIVNSPGKDMSFVRTDSIGNVIWNKFIDVPGGIFGVAMIVDASAIQTFDGGYFCIFSVYDSYTYSSYGGYFKTDANGDTLWTGTYNGSFSSVIKQTADSGFILAVNNYFFCGGGCGGQVCHGSSLTKINQFGSKDWLKSYYTNAYDNVITDVNQTSDGGFIISGYFGDNCYPRNAILVRTNEFGDTLWTHPYDSILGYATCGIQKFNSIQQTSDGGFIACAKDLVVKTDSMGIPIWAKSYSVGSLYTELSSIQVTNNGEYLLSGTASDSLYYWRFCLIKTDSNLNSNCNVSACTPPMINYLPNVYSSGPSNPNSASFTFGSYPIISSVWDSIIDINTLCFSLGVENNDVNSKLSIFPNPNDGLFTIHLDHAGNEYLKISIIDLTGRLTFEKDIGKTGELFNETVDMRNLPNGMYLVRASVDDHAFSQKIILWHNR